MARILDSDDMTFHMLIVGGTGSGKTNAILRMLNLLFDKEEKGKPRPALFLFDPAGDASIDLLRSIPSAEWGERVVVLDPQYVTFGFNLLSLPEGLAADERADAIQTQAGEFAVLLSDVFNTDATTAPRLMWIFKGALYYLYTFTDDPTFWDLYNIMILFAKKSPGEVGELLRRRNVQAEVIRETMEAISKLPADAYMPVINRLSNFVLPPSSITFRTFCSRKSTIDLEKRMEPGSLTIFRMPSGLPVEFRRLLASAVVMKLYFASLKRANRLERSGQPPIARTPVVLAADEFRDVAQLGILRTMLSQSRKFGLYLWMVMQTLSEVPQELTESVQANVGPILAFRSSPDDARKLAKLLSPQRTGPVESLIPGLEDYTAVVRKRPVGGRPPEAPFRVTFPKLRDPFVEYSDAMGYLKGNMERLYGGTAGDRNLIYHEELEKAKKERGDCPIGGPLYWMPLAYLHRIGTDIAFSHMARIFEERCGWEKNVLQVGLNFLADRGWVKEAAKAGQLYMGMDPDTGQPMWKEPETQAEKMQARQVFYSITDAAQDEFFRFDPKKWAKSGRVGGPLHVRAMRQLLEKYWEKEYWCAFDRGDREGPFPDILYTKPLIIYARGKEGRTVARVSTDEWDEESRTAVEIEITPSKNPEQVRENHSKNVVRYGKAAFVVVSREQITDIRNILQDKDKTTFEVVYEDVGLAGGELEWANEHGDVERVEGKKDASKQAPPPAISVDQTRLVKASDLEEAELHLLALVLKLGYQNKKILGSDLGVSESTVTRLLRHLRQLGLIVKEGNGYSLMQDGRRLAEMWNGSAGSGKAGQQAKLG